MYIPLWLLITALVIFAGLATWSYLLASGRNPLPFPDPGSRIFTTPSDDARAAVVSLMSQYGVNERFRADGDGVIRSILYDGTIINCASPEILEKLGHVTACIGLVAADPLASANAAADFLRARGFDATVIPDIEPGLPVSFVLTNALSGSAINFRKHVVHMPRPGRN